MRVEYFGHSHHRTTRSSQFLLRSLRRLGDVQEHWVESWRTGGALDDRALWEPCDAVVIWQVEAVAEALARRRLPNVTFFPMYDSCHAHPDSFWRRLDGMKVVCFCAALHARLQRLGVRSRYVQFHPAPAAEVGRRDELTGYFWQRRPEVTWSTVRTLLGDAAFRRFTVQYAPDPEAGTLPPPSEEDVRRFGIRLTGWDPSSEGYEADLRGHSVYFAPRAREGIGMSFLEAMARGLLVVAPDRPTMSEYLVSGANGLLYDPEHPAALDFTHWRELARRARVGVEVGRTRWARTLPALLEFIRTPCAAVPARRELFALDPLACHAGRSPERARPQPGGRPASRPRRVPGVAVVVRGNARDGDTASTLASVAEQDGVDAVSLVTADSASLPWALHSGSDAQDGAGPLSRRYVLFLEPGDRLLTRDTLATALLDLPDDDDPVLIGHHVHRGTHGIEELRITADFARSYEILRRGHVSWSWLDRLPARCGVLWPTRLLREQGNTEEPADGYEERLCALARCGARFRHCLVPIAVHRPRGRGIGDRRRSLERWWQIGRRHTTSVEALRAALAQMQQEVATRDLHELSTSALLLRVGTVPGAFREIKRRSRARAARGRMEPRQRRSPAGY